MEEEQTFKGRDVATEAREMGTDGGWSDYQLKRIKAHSYRLVEVPVAEILAADPDLAAYVNAGTLRQYEGTANLDFAPIISNTGEVLDGYNRILQHVQNGTEKIDIYQAVGKPRESVKGGAMEDNKEREVSKEPKGITIKNEYLLKAVEDDPEQKRHYTELMEKATQGLKEAAGLTPGEKARIADELNSEVAAGVIKHWGKNVADVLYSGVCMEKGGDPYLHEKYTRPDNRPFVDDEFKVCNKHLMEQVDGLPDLERKYKAAQEALSKEVFYSNITYSDKKKIVDSLNSEAGAKLIANHSAQAEIVVYAGLCLADGGGAALDKYPIPEEVRSQSLAAGKGVGRLKTKAADMGI